MRTLPIVALGCVVLTAAPASSHAASESEGENAEQNERARMDRTWRIGTGLLWGGVGTAGAGGLTLLGLIPTQKDLRLAEARRSLCMLSSPECPEQESEIQRWTRARNAVAISGSLLVGSGLALVAVGVWKRRTARRQLDALDQRTKPEWSIGPSLGPSLTGVVLVARF